MGLELEGFARADRRDRHTYLALQTLALCRVLSLQPS